MTSPLESLSERLRYALKTLKISQTELAKRIKIKPQVIQYLCTGESQKSKFTLEIADALNIDFLWLATGKGAPPNSADTSTNENMIPILSFSEIRENKINNKEIDLSKVTNWIPINAEENNNYFAVILNDKSMSPRFDLNTIIIIDPTYSINNSTQSNQFILVYLHNDDFIVFRQLKKSANNDFLLAPINNNLYKDILLKENDIILGTCKEARWNT